MFVELDERATCLEQLPVQPYVMQPDVFDGMSRIVAIEGDAGDVHPLNRNTRQDNAVDLTDPPRMCAVPHQAYLPGFALGAKA